MVTGGEPDSGEVDDKSIFHFSQAVLVLVCNGSAGDVKEACIRRLIDDSVKESKYITPNEFEVTVYTYSEGLAATQFVDKCIYFLGEFAVIEL